MSRPAILAAGLLALSVAADGEQSYRVYTEHPRLWLEARRLRLLRRERERESVRWLQVESLLAAGRQPLPEEPLARALQFQVAGQEDAGRRAIAWAMARTRVSAAPDAAELRLLAVVFDWCYSLLSDAERASLVQRIARGIEAAGSAAGMKAFAGAALAAIAVADDWLGSEQSLRAAFENRWPASFLPALRGGPGFATLADAAAFLELCHAARDNLHLDLWRQAPAFFKQFPYYLLLQYYPPTLAIDSHPFRQPSEWASAASNPAAQGETARIAEMLTAAYDTNSVETQYLQGWIAHDLYRVRTPSGALYEFLWMNPYQPGLSYYNVPLLLHDRLAGRLLARSSWDDDGTWLGYSQGQVQIFADGRPSLVDPATQTAPIVFPQVAVMPVKGDASFRVQLAEGEDVFVVGLESGRTYWIRTGEGKFAPQTAEKGGILALRAPVGVETAFELKTVDPNPPPPSLQRKGR